MNKLALIVGILCCLVAAIIFVFAEGLRRWYSGVFFALIGVFTILQAARWRRSTDR